MVANLVTAQVIRYVTERVIENLSRQAGRTPDGGTSAGYTASLTDLAVTAKMNERLDDFEESLAEVDERFVALNRRLDAIEGKVGWRYTFRLTIGVIAGIAIGFAAASLAHLAGWMG